MKEDINDFIQAELRMIYTHISSVCLTDEFDLISDLCILNSFYSDELEVIVMYLSFLQHSANMIEAEFHFFHKKALKFVVKENQLFHQTAKNVSFKHIINDSADQERIMKKLHKENDH